MTFPYPRCSIRNVPKSVKDFLLVLDLRLPVEQ
jgi:hypothetical protein